VTAVGAGPGRGEGSGLHVEALAVRAGTAELLRELTVHLAGGQVLVVTGPAAIGKSVLLETLAAQRRPAAGGVRMDGRPVSDPAVRERTGYLPQVVEVFDALTAVENVALTLLARPGSPTQAWARSEALLERLGIPAATRHNLAEQLSGGQRQRVAFARATVHEPRLVIADDPTSELDPATAAQVVGVLRDLADAGSVVVVATTDAEVRELGDLCLDLADLRR
jgi:ABC-type multidrug transport system ATPase subunit